MTVKTASQLKAQLGANDPVEFQRDMVDSAWLKGEVASQAEAEAGTATNKVMTPERTAQAIAALGGGGGVTDYENVVVVDAGGNGDYATLGEAMASISTASSTNRFVVLCFGDTTETQNIVTKAYVDIIGMGGSIGLNSNLFQIAGSPDTIRIANLRFNFNGAGIEFLSTCNAVFYNCNFGASRLYGSSGGTAKFYGCSSILFDAIDGVILDFYNCEFSSSNWQLLTDEILQTKLLFVGCKFLQSTPNYPIIYRAATLTARFVDCYFENTRTAGAGYALVVDLTGGILELYNCVLIAKGHASSRGLSIVTGADAPLLVACYCEGGGANLAVYSASVLAAAPFYQSTFKNGTTNVTCHAGTANGTCVNF